MKTNNKLTGSIKSASMCLPIEGAEIKLVNKTNDILLKTFTDKKGFYEIQLIPGAEKLVFAKDGYLTKSVDINSNELILIRLLEDTIYAYTDKLSYKPGETVNVYVNSPTNYSCSLIRNGLKREFVYEIGNYPPIYQDIPNGLFVDKGLNWSKAFSFTISVDVKSGLYSLFFNSVQPNKSYSLSLIISPIVTSGSINKKILVLSSSNNWQTYNIWGGRSRYRNFENPGISSLKQKLWALGIRFLPESIKSAIKKSLGEKAILSVKDHPNAFQFKKLSINRPHPNCSIYDQDVYSEFTSHLAAGEWRILAWLEREGFDYDLIGGYELHCNPAILANYKTFILSTHSEYWSKEMFSSLKNFYENGGSIFNLSGNSIYREIEFFDDGSLRCVSLRFNDTAEDESQLIGVRFDMRGYGSCTAFEVKKPEHWAFNGTNLKENDLFAQKSLNHNVKNLKSSFDIDPASSPGMANLIGNGGSGWETDKLTTTAPKDFILLAKGKNKNNGGADMIIRETTGKGIIFSASSITFGGSLLIDRPASVIVKNVLDKALNH
jgi:hypothetical protein